MTTILSMTLMMAAMAEAEGAPAWAIAYDFAERLPEGNVTSGTAPSSQREAAGGELRSALFHHPPLEGGASSIVFENIALPRLGAGESYELRFAIGFPDRLKVAEIASFDGCLFRVLVNGLAVFEEAYAERAWQTAQFCLDEYEGETITLTFSVEARSNSNGDWALWGEPVILIKGRQAEVKQGPQTSALAIENLRSAPMPRRVFHHKEGDQLSAVVAAIDPDLDLALAVEAARGEAGAPPVPLGPELVAGQGPHPENHTFIRVLSRYGLPKLQFLAFPPEVRGGVGVTVRIEAGAPVIYARPLGQDAPRQVRVFTPWGRLVREMSTEQAAEFLPPLGATRFPSAFQGETLSAAGAGPDESVLTVEREGQPARTIHVAEREKRFWYTWHPWEHGREDGPISGKHVRYGRFLHLRTDVASPGREAAAFANADPEFWAGSGFISRFSGHLEGYASEPPAMWEPCFTHRWPKAAFEEWAGIRDESTGFPKYLMLTRNNNGAEYGEFGSMGFHMGTYAFGLPAIERLYVWPLRAFLHELAPRFRANPEHFVGVEPNHEHEIAVAAEGTQGDYNLKMIEGFYHYLTRLYGDDLEALRQALGAPFGEYFDAPRDWGRGAWDAYKPDNPFFAEWIRYNRYVVSRRIAQTLREGLLAGFPPEAIKTHQIPDTYALGDLSSFSTVMTRFSPIDYALTAGTGYGFTRYSVWYERPFNVMQGAHSSGFDQTSIGEYQALTPDLDEAYSQLRYIFDKGGYYAHCMVWPQGHDRGFNEAMAAALDRLLEEDPPRRGQAGGAGQARPVAYGTERYNIVSIGTGPNRTGLLKSIDRHGRWTGAIYATPFRARIQVDELPMRAFHDGRLAAGPLAFTGSGHQIEAVIGLRGEGGLGIAVERDGVALPGLQTGVESSPEGIEFRYVLRFQLPMENVRVVLTPHGDAQVTARATHQFERAVKLTRNILDGARHKGGVTFDVLTPSYRAE